MDKSDFGHKLQEKYLSGLEIYFETSRTSYGVYLIGRIVFDEQHFILHKKLGYDDIILPLSKKEYRTKNQKEIIDDLSDILMRLVEFANFYDMCFKKFKEYSLSNNPTNWKQKFTNELTDMFGSIKTSIVSCGIELVICFDEGTNVISVTLRKGKFSLDEKPVLQCTVNENNYREVVSILKKILADFKYVFYDINGITKYLKDLCY